MDCVGSQSPGEWCPCEFQSNGVFSSKATHCTGCMGKEWPKATRKQRNGLVFWGTQHTFFVMFTFSTIRQVLCPHILPQDFHYKDAILLPVLRSFPLVSCSWLVHKDGSAFNVQHRITWSASGWSSGPTLERRTVNTPTSWAFKVNRSLLKSCQKLTGCLNFLTSFASSVCLIIFPEFASVFMPTPKKAQTVALTHFVSQVHVYFYLLPSRVWICVSSWFLGPQGSRDEPTKRPQSRDGKFRMWVISAVIRMGHWHTAKLVLQPGDEATMISPFRPTSASPIRSLTCMDVSKVGNSNHGH